MAAALVAVLGIAQQPFDLDIGFRTNMSQVSVSSIALLPDGDLLLSGNMRFSGESFNRRTARLNPDGTRDAAFPASGIGGGKLTEWQGRYYVGGTQYPRRIWPTGQQDGAFQSLNSNAPLFSSLQGGDYHVYPDGRIVISGAHTMNEPEHGFVGLYNLIWFTNTGQLDTSKHHRQCDEVIYEFEEQPDGKFLCSGTMTSYEGQSVSRIFRVHPDGALDDSFQVPFDDWGEAFAFHTLPDGRILAGGVFRNQAQTDTLCLLRLLPDGSLDPSFQSVRCKATFGAIPLGYVLDVRVLEDTRIVISGRFDEVNGHVRGGFALLNSDGTLLEDAFAGEGCGPYNYNGTVYKGGNGCAQGNDGHIYIWGAYHGYDDGTTNDPTQRFVSRLYGLNVGVREQERAPLQLHPNPTYGPMSVTLPATTTAQHAEVLDAHGRVVWSMALGASTEHLQLDLAALSEGAYVLRLRMKDGGVRSGRFVVLR